MEQQQRLKRLGGVRYNKKLDGAVMNMGAWLRKARIRRGHTQRDVAQAIGRSIQYISEVEHGRRGHKMEPVTALQWCEYLNLDSGVMFGHLQLGESELERWRVRHYLETSAWASKYMRALRILRAARSELKELLATLRVGTRERDVAKALQEHIDAAITCLHVPRKSHDVDEPEVSHAQHA